MSSIKMAIAKRKRIYLDLDGVFADFDTQYQTVFGHKPKGRKIPSDHWDRIYNSSFFLSMPVIKGSKDFYKSLTGLNVSFLTACPHTAYRAIANDKRTWIHAHIDSDADVLPVLGSKSKPLFMHRRGDILIDDSMDNCEQWSLAGGTAIHHTSFEETRGQLMLSHPTYNKD